MVVNFPHSQSPTRLPLPPRPSSPTKPQITFKGVVLFFWHHTQQHFPLCTHQAHPEGADASCWHKYSCVQLTAPHLRKKCKLKRPICPANKKTRRSSAWSGFVGEMWKTMMIYDTYNHTIISKLMLQKFIWPNLSSPVIWKTFNITYRFKSSLLKLWKWENNMAQGLTGNTVGNIKFHS